MVGKSCLATLGSANSFGIRVSALTSEGRVGAIPLGIARDRYCVWLLYKQANRIILLPFLLIHIEHSTFHPADCRGRLQTIRQFRRSDFRRSTQACFPLFIHSGINYPPAAGWSPFLSRKELRFASFPFLSFGILAFYKNAIRRIRLQIGFANLPLVSNL